MVNSNKNIKRVLALGHSGFIGSHIKRIFEQFSPEIEFIGRSYPSIDLTKKDDALSLLEFFDKNTVVIMLSGIKRQLGDSLEIFNKNISMVSNVCHILEDNPVKRFIYFSSAAVYGEEIHNTKINEDTPVNPFSYYGIAKYTSECILRKVIGKQEYGTLLCIRPPLVYGPGDQTKIYGPSGFSINALNKEKITLWGDGSELREFMYVEDIAKIVHNLTFLEYAGVLNISSGKSYNFKEILDVISNILPYNLEIDTRPRTRKQVDNKFQNNKLLEVLPDASFTGLENGIKNIIDELSELDKQTMRKD